jgi:hypothetical protein
MSDNEYHEMLHMLQGQGLCEFSDSDGVQFQLGLLPCSNCCLFLHLAPVARRGQDSANGKRPVSTCIRCLASCVPWYPVDPSAMSVAKTMSDAML